MAEHHLVYHWKHGWIPLTHAAALSKAKGNSKLADKYVRGTSSHHADRATAGRSARELHGGLEKHARIMAHPGTFRGESGHHITGTDTHGRKVAVFVPGDRASAQRAIDNIHRGLPAFHGAEHAPKAPAVNVPTGGPTTPADAFRMSGPELRQHAAGGSKMAQAELDRRAAKKGLKPSASPPQPKLPAAAAPQPSQPSRGDLKVGDQVSVKAGGGTRIGTVQAFDTGGRAHVHVPGHGTVIRSADEVSKDIHPSTKAAEDRRRLGDFRNTPTETLQRALAGNATLEQKDAYRAELKRRGVREAPATTVAPAPANPGDAKKEAALARWQGENATIAPAGHTITSRLYAFDSNGSPRGQHTQYAPNGERLGSVVEQSDGRYLAMYNGKDAGRFDARAEAHRAIADRHQAVTDAAQKKVEAAQRRQAKATKVGHFDPHVLESDGTRAGDAAVAKIKQSFKLNDHTVHIEAALTKDQTKVLLDNIHSVLLKSGHLDSHGIEFHVPTGHSTFRQTRRGVAGGYVRQGQRAIFINPKVATGEISAGFGGPSSSDSFMPAARGTNGQQYVIAHELGHVLDNEHSHTKETSFLGSQRVEYSSTRESASVLHKEHRGSLSSYGQTSVSEGYAEAYAQWVHGGPGSSTAADAFAAQFGWKPPKWYREGRAA